MSGPASRTGPRVLLVARHFWPLCDDSTQRLTNLAEGLRRAGAHVTILSPRHGTAWPERIVHREINVERPLDVPRGFWSISRYIRATTRWIVQHASEFDVLYADAMREEAAAVVAASRDTGLPSVLRYQGCGKNADAAWWRESRGGLSYLRQVLLADAFVAPRPSAGQQLVAVGVPSDRIARIDDGVPALPRITPAEREAARRALFSINREFRLDPDSRVVLMVGRLTKSSGAWHYVEAACNVISRWPGHRLWIVGEGPERDRLVDDIRQCGLVGDVLLPGTFDHYDEVLDAADVAFISADAECLDAYLPAAVARGIPLLASQSVDVRAFFGPDAEFVNWFKPADVKDMTEQLLKILANYDDAIKAADTLRNKMLSRRSLQETIDAHYRLFARLSHSSQSSRPAESSP